MGAPEPPPLLIWMRVKNADAEDYGRVGMLVDMLGEDEGVGRTFVIDFQDGHAPVAFSPDEIERIYTS